MFRNNAKAIWRKGVGLGGLILPLSGRSKNPYFIGVWQHAPRLSVPRVTLWGSPAGFPLHD